MQIVCRSTRCLFLEKARLENEIYACIEDQKSTSEGSLRVILEILWNIVVV